AAWPLARVPGPGLAPGRFRGPPGRATGGYAAGRGASYRDGPAEVTLRSPPPLDEELRVDRESDGRVIVRAGDRLVAEARPVDLPPEAPAPVGFADAQAAARAHPPPP